MVAWSILDQEESPDTALYLYRCEGWVAGNACRFAFTFLVEVE